MIAIVEDDNSIRELISYTLCNVGFEARGYSEGASFFESLAIEVPELLILDVMLPKEDGISILKKIRSNPETAKIPVIMVTAKDTEYDKIIGLDNGADDYVTKPFGIMELISRIKAVLRRTMSETEKTSNAWTHKNLSLDDSAHSVTSSGELIELTLKEYNLLKLLLENEGYVMNRDLLLQKIWGYDFDGETRTIDVHIRTLRTKLGECGKYIETVRGVGYKIGGAK